MTKSAGESGDTVELRILGGVDWSPPATPSSCHATWLVFASDAERDVLEQGSWPRARERLCGEPLFHRRSWRGERGWEVATWKDRCVFLSEQGRCEVQEAGGADRLPSTCNRQPFCFTRVAGEELVFVGVDWSSPGVRAAESVPLERSRARLERLASDPLAVVTLPPQPELGRKKSLGAWSVYEEAESVIVGLLDHQRLPLSVGLAAAAQVPRLALEFLTAMLKVPGGLSAYPLSRYLADQKSGTRQEPFRAQLAAVAGQIPDRRAGRRRLADAVTLFSGVASGRSRPAILLELLGNGMRSRSGVDEYRWSLLGGLPRIARELTEVPFPIGDPALADLLRAYLIHVVRRRLLLPRAGLLRGMAFLAVLYALIREVARALAHDLGAEAVSPTLLRQAIAEVEAAYALERGTDALLTGSGPLSRRFDRMLTPRNYATSLILPLEPGGGEFRFLNSEEQG